MNKFWQWMTVKRYSCVGLIGRALIADNQPLIYPTPQMLIGYKLEYVRDHEFWNNATSEDDMTLEQLIINNRLSSFWSCPYMTKELDSIIEVIDKEETP